jgi:tRNA(Ile)-lysidine synthase
LPTSADRFQEKAFKEFKKLEIQRNSTILLCVSGGCDSVAMLHLLGDIRNNYLKDLDLKVVNFNHKMRPESDQEAEFVKKLAMEYNMDFFQRILPEEFRGENFSQDAGRNWRQNESLSILESLSSNNEGSQYIATAHHMEDQMETILMRILRGVHISNIQGIASKSGKFLRPLLQFHKEEFVDYLKTQQLTWHEDSSNAERDYLRNKVRLDLIPLMSSLAGSSLALQRRLLTLSQQSQMVKTQLDESAVTFAKLMGTVSFRDYHALYFIGEQSHTVSNTTTAPAEEVTSEPSLTPVSEASSVTVSSYSFANIPPLVFQSILFEWISAKTGIHLEQSRLTEFTSLFQRNDPKGHAVESSITISKKWDLQRSRDEIRLVLRKKDKFGNFNNTNATSWISTGFELEGGTNRAASSVEIVHPSDMVVKTEGMAMNTEEFLPTNEDQEPIPGENIHVEFDAPNEVPTDNILRYIRENPWVSKFELFIPVPNQVGKSKKSKQEQNRNGLVFRIRWAKPTDFFVHEHFKEGVKVKNLVNKLRHSRPDLGLSNDRVLVIKTNIPVTDTATDKIQTESSSIDRRRDNSQKSENNIVAVLLPDAIIYSEAYSQWLQQPTVTATSVIVQVQVPPSPEITSM